MTAAASLGESSLWAAGVLGTDYWPGIPGAQSSGTAAGTGNPKLLSCTCYHGAAGAVGPAYTDSLVSLAFQSKGSRSCSREKHGAPSSSMCQETGLTAKHAE
jgi:hypothetical protein